MAQPYYQDEWVTLYHGDCLEITEWLSVDVLVTDPPYGIDWRAGSTTSYTSPRQEVRSLVGDSDSGLRDAALVLWAGKPALVFGSWRVDRPVGVRHRLIWHKAGRMPGVGAAPWFSCDEEIYVLGVGFVGPSVSNVYRTSELRHFAVRDTGHPTPKPLQLMESLIAKCPPGIVADPFSGSGSTLVAAKALGRRAIGVEIEERYCEVTANRLTQDVLDFSEATA